MIEKTINITVYLSALFVIACLLFSAMSLNTKSERLRKFTDILTAFFLSSLSALLVTFLMNRKGTPVSVIMTLCIYISYLLMVYAYPLLFSYLLQIKRDNFFEDSGSSMILKSIWMIGSAEIVLLIINLFTNALFSVNADNQIVFGKLFGSFELMVLLQIVLMLIMAAVNTSNRLARGPVLSICILPGIGALWTIMNQKISLILPLTALSLLLIYVNVYLQNEADIMHKELELRENRLSILIGQIQPHFVFNVLNTIYYLCDIDQKSASAATNKLRKYLEANFNDFDTGEPVPFEKELTHVKMYTDLEKLRFDQIEFIYDIQETDFLIPALTVQPLVENAVRHGCREMSGGRIVISSKKEGSHYIVEVRDNGTGYHPEAHNDGRRHVGIENVERRLSLLANASLDIHALEEGGTSARIIIEVS